MKRPTEPIALASFDVVDAVSETHEITIHFEGEDYRPSFFDDADLRVVGNGFETRPTFVRWQAIRQGDVGYEAHYVISAPEGGWTEAHNGSVAVWLEPEQVARVQGFVAAQMVGTFQVCLGEMTRLESVRYELRGNADDVMGCSAMQSPHGCNRRLTVRVIQERNSEFYIPNVEYAERWEGAVKQDGDVWFLELYQVPKRRYPYEPLWHPRSNVFGGGFRTVGRFTFEPPPGVYEFQLRSMGEVIAREPLTVARNPKVRSESGLVITAPGDVDPVVTVGYWHPEGVDIDSLGDDDLSADAAYTPGRLPPMGERVTFLGAKKDGEWLVGRYRIASPPGGWSFLENGRFVLRTQLGLLRTLTGAQFAESESPPVEGFRVQIDEPFTGPIHVLVRRSAASIVDEALETKVTVTYTADTEVLDLESIDATDLVVMEGVTVIRDAIEVSEQGRVATVEYRVRVGGQIGLGELIVVELAEGAVSTVSGESNRVAPLLGFLNEVPNPRELVVSPATIRKPGALPFRFTIRYPKGALPDHTFEPPSVDVVAVWMREGHWEGPRPPMPFRQTAKIVDTFVLNGRDLQTVEYEILAPDIGWSHLLNGQLALEIEGYSEKPSIKIAVLEARVEASLEIEEAFPGIVGKVKVKTFNEPAVTAVTDWRMIHGAEGTVYLDAIVSPLDVLIPGPIPEYYEQEHTFTLWDLQLPLAFAEFGETDVIVRVNGESLVQETVLPVSPPHEPVSPHTLEMNATAGSVELTMAFDAQENDFVVVNWGHIVAVDEQNLLIEGAVFMAAPDRMTADRMTRLNHRYGFVVPREASYRVELIVNDRALAESFYLGGPTSFDSWRRFVASEAGGLNRLIVNGKRRRIGDLDGDGYSDFEEYAFASEILDPNVRPKLGRAIEEGTGRLGVYFQWPWERDELRYTLETSVDLLDWTPHRQLTRSRWKSNLDHRVFLNEGDTAPFMRVRAEIAP